MADKKFVPPPPVPDDAPNGFSPPPPTPDAEPQPSFGSRVLGHLKSDLSGAVDSIVHHPIAAAARFVQPMQTESPRLPQGTAPTRPFQFNLHSTESTPPRDWSRDAADAVEALPSVAAIPGLPRPIGVSRALDTATAAIRGGAKGAATAATELPFVGKVLKMPGAIWGGAKEEVRKLSPSIASADVPIAAVNQSELPQVAQGLGPVRPPLSPSVDPRNIPSIMNQAQRRATALPPETGNSSIFPPVRPPIGVNTPFRPPMAPRPLPQTYPFAPIPYEPITPSYTPRGPMPTGRKP